MGRRHWELAGVEAVSGENVQKFKRMKVKSLSHREAELK
jgi:hypothetical protein